MCFIEYVFQESVLYDSSDKPELKRFLVVFDINFD